MFGTPNVAQNLTYADGDNGWSYNDKNKGTYLFFTHADTQISYGDPMKQTNDTAGEANTAVAKDAGTAFGSNVIILTGVAGLLAGFFIGVVTTNTRRKKRQAKTIDS